MHIAKLLRSRRVPDPDQRLSAQRIGTGKTPLSEEGQLACKNYQITVTEIYASRSSDKHWSVSISVEALLYGKSTLSDILQQVRPKEAITKVPVCTWIHVPENNVSSSCIRCLAHQLTLLDDLDGSEYLHTVE